MGLVAHRLRSKGRHICALVFVSSLMVSWSPALASRDDTVDSVKSDLCAFTRALRHVRSFRDWKVLLGPWYEDRPGKHQLELLITEFASLDADAILRIEEDVLILRPSENILRQQELLFLLHRFIFEVPTYREEAGGWKLATSQAQTATSWPVARRVSGRLVIAGQQQGLRSGAWFADTPIRELNKFAELFRRRSEITLESGRRISNSEKTLVDDPLGVWK
jgi:hypothetical protein